ncbi:hypothetical protein COM13_11300 [Bacillus pseudomycoides]|uniref:Uncharacterized protein n=1 Tax=Bacillus pseudomycoides TaxID=64104 RepID=A0A2A8GRU5_9BACI|nr:hypothetical protein [Bacillus pseudomycoides]MDR4188251.1 hypothetical protein [Bacillus pseudomycoides]MDR4328394.1 hypothetical protein [Bacillus pseudomycoides]OOR48688.1 hypothetical protein BLX05_28180 [Bacillus pseudomycoides]PDY02180.1 hypothetical protein COO07_01120 [Bacillus pseudomycoides]
MSVVLLQMCFKNSWLIKVFDYFLSVLNKKSIVSFAVLTLVKNVVLTRRGYASVKFLLLV